MEIHKIVLRSTAAACALTLVYILYLNVVFMAEKNLSAYFLCICACMVALYILAGKVKLPARVFLPVLIVVSLAVKIGLALAIDARPTSDFELLYNSARQVAAGDYSFHNIQYFVNWGYQTGFVAYEALVIRLFGEGTAALMVLNCLFMTATHCIIYLTVRRLTGDDRAAAFAALLHLFYPAQYLMVSVLTNQHLSACLIWLGLYLIITSERPMRLRPAAGGLIIALGHIIRPLGIIAMAAVAAYFLLCAVTEIKTSGWRTSLGGLIRAGSAVAAYVLTGLLFSVIVVSSGLNPHGTGNNEPLWKFVAGLNMETGGVYGEELAYAVFDIEDPVRRHEVEREYLSRSLNAPLSKWSAFFYRKNRYMWADYESENWSFGRVASRNRSEAFNQTLEVVVPRALKADKAYYVCLLALALWAALTLLAGRRLEARVWAVMAVFLLYFGAHLLIEVQTRYRDFIIPAVCILAGYALLRPTRRRGEKQPEDSAPDTADTVASEETLSAKQPVTQITAAPTPFLIVF